MSQFTIKAETRTGLGKEKVAKIRQAGNSPAVVYGTNKDAVSLTINTREAELVIQRMHGEKILVDLVVDGAVEKVFVRNIQRDPLSDKLLHIDFYRVDMDREIDTIVSVTEVGVAEGVKLGGLLEHGLRQLHIRALPGDVPPHIEVNVAPLQQGQSIHVKDLPAIKGVKIIARPDAILFAVVGKQKEDAPAAPTA
ncbi:50S ribosomal protein L25 [bacterium]|nr:50S ribosomal protein L25 [bacterium]